MIAFDAETKSLGTEIFRQHTIADVTLYTVYCFVQSEQKLLLR